MALYTKLDNVPLEALRRLLQTLKEKYQREMGGSSDMVRRTLRPEDLGLTGEWTFATGGTGWVTLVDSQTVADNTFIGIYGVRNLTTSTPQNITQLKVTRSGTVARYWDIQGLNQFDTPEGFFDDPISIDSNNTITIEGYSLSSADEKLALIGEVVEKTGITINPSLL